MTAILDRSTELTREANALLGQKDLVNASLKYIEALSLYPKNVVALHNLAALQISTGQPAMIMGALYQLNAAASLLKSDQYRADYALALAQSGHGRMALKYLNAHRNAFQNSAAVDSLIQQIASQMDLKRAALKSVLARKSSPLALKELNAFIEKREFDRAIAVFNKQLDHDITDARIWRLIGHAYRMSLKMQEAQSAIRAGLAMAPSDYDLHILQIEYLTFSNAQLASVACARGSLEALAPNVRLLSSSAYAYIFAKKPDEAAALEILLDHVDRQVPPTESGADELELGRRVGDEPRCIGDDTVVVGCRRHALADHDLHMTPRVSVRDRPANGCKWMLGCRHGHHRDVG